MRGPIVSQNPARVAHQIDCRKLPVGNSSDHATDGAVSIPQNGVFKMHAGNGLVGVLPD